MAGLLFVWSAGAVLGPAVAGAAFDTQWGGHALFTLAVVGALALIVSMLGRRLSQAAAEAGLKVPFFAAPPSPSVAMAEIVGDSASDPRIPASKP